METLFPHWERLHLRNYLIAHPEVSAEYGRVKTHLAEVHRNDREAYNLGKSDFISRVMPHAIQEAGFDPACRRDVPPKT
jgi:GrpB-like predicted nucleotidyltransferase (UPF0157 family)